jgi:pimeloyl-ACP methyl ester carboxylesterase
MPHVTFIHGISNKPPADDLLRIWRRALAEATEPLPLGNLGVTSSMVYWADLLYEKPEDDLSAYEGVLENTAEAIDGAGNASLPTPRTPQEEAFLKGLRAQMTALSDEDLATTEPPPVPAEPQGALERVPLPWFIKKRFLNAHLRDVHHYLFDVEFAPPGKPPARIQQTIRRRFVAALDAANVSAPHIVVSHSMGTVIAYDCLKRVGDCPPVDGLITIGSPLGLDEIQDQLQPGWTRNDGFPHEKVRGGWANLFDRLDPVCGFDPKLANDYRKGGVDAIEDLAVQNDGKWRHSATKYLRQSSFCAALRRMLGV